MMVYAEKLIFLSVFLSLTGCETKEDVTKRFTQFNGKTLERVSRIIGAPALHNKTRAVWFYEAIYTEYRPYYRLHSYGHKHSGHHGYGYTESIPYTYRLNCTYIAELNVGRVTRGTYTGNSCLRFAPKPQKPNG